MELTDYIVIGVILLVIGAAVAYIVKAKKSGKKCIGCPYSDSCGKAEGCCSCNSTMLDRKDDADK